MAEKNKIDFKALLRRVRSICTRNWQWKLLSLLIAICLWSGLITQDDSLTREKTFTDVTINVVNSDTLRRNGYIIVSGLEDLPTVRIRANVPQKVYNTVKASNYNLRVDLSQISGVGEQTLNIISTSTATFGSVTEISVSTITVQVEEYITRSRIPVSIAYSGALPDGLYSSSVSVDPGTVAVSGPKSLVNSIVRCVADYNMSVLTDKTGVERTAVPFRLLNGSGNAVDTSLLSVTSESVILDSIIVEQTLYRKKELVINTTGLTTGTPAEGYEVKRISAEPASVQTAGTSELLESLTDLHLIEYATGSIDISGLSSTISRNIRVTKPEGMTYLSDETILVTIEIAPK